MASGVPNELPGPGRADQLRSHTGSTPSAGLQTMLSDGIVSTIDRVAVRGRPTSSTAVDIEAWKPVADRARNKGGLGKAVTFNVITPMTRVGTWVVKILLWYFDRRKSTQQTAKDLAFLPFVHWVVVGRDQFPCVDATQRPERLNYDYLFFLSTFNGPWGPYIEAFADVLYVPLDAVWFWSVGYPFARPVTPLKAYIQRNQVESDHSYSAYPGASVRDVRSALELRKAILDFAESALSLPDAAFMTEFDRLLIAVQDKLGTFGTIALQPASQ
jgi:hypothetical protein